MIKLLIGGSPCTYWSIAQTDHRETKAEGIGWELFKNYLVAKEKFKPDFFLYENNKSAAEPIKAQIREELGVTDAQQFDFFHEDVGARYIEINSALVSAQNRQRFYVHNCGEVKQPKDRGILLTDILESATALQDKARTVISSCGRTTEREYFKKNQSNMCAIPVEVEPKQVGAMPRPNGDKSTSQAFRVYSCDGKSVTMNAGGGGAGGKTGLYAIPVNDANGKARTIKAQYSCNSVANFVANGGFDATGIAEPVFPLVSGKARCVTSRYASHGAKEIVEKYFYENPAQQNWDSVAEPLCFAVAVEYGEDGKPTKAVCGTDGKTYPVYEVKDGKITIKGKQYPIHLADDFYIIRKLTVKEVARLQTMPDDYCHAVSDSQAYKCLGNGWTAEVIIHILSTALKDVPKDEKIVVLSMYDGIATGRYCLDRMGFTNVEYHAYEIDKYAIKVALSNYPDIIEHGDAFQLREENWKL